MRSAAEIDRIYAEMQVKMVRKHRNGLACTLTLLTALLTSVGIIAFYGAWWWLTLIALAAAIVIPFLFQQWIFRRIDRWYAKEIVVVRAACLR